jgi:hypothetical protein
MADKIDAATATMIRNLEEKTGKSLAEWVAVARQGGAAKHGDVVKRLKSEHGLGHGYANLIAHEALSGLVSKSQTESGEEDLVAAQYAGDKAGLRGLYEQLVAAVAGFGPDVEISPKKTYVSLRRSKQFALVQPSTKTRLDVGINLKGAATTARLEASGSFNAMVSHRVRLAPDAVVDAELVGWLRQAYDQA